MADNNPEHFRRERLDVEAGKRQVAKRPLGIVVVSSLMILFGIIEVATGFSHDFVGISTSTSLASTIIDATIGAFYTAAGLLTFTMKRWAVLCAIALLIADVIGRLGLVATGLFPLDSTENITGIVGGTCIAAIFAVYLLRRVSSLFSREPTAGGKGGEPKGQKNLGRRQHRKDNRMPAAPDTFSGGNDDLR